MRRFILLLLLAFFLTACIPMVATGTPVLPPTPTATPTPTPFPTLTPVPTPSHGFRVEYHPDGELYVGDQVSLSIIAMDEQDTYGREVEITYQDQPIGQTVFDSFGVGGRVQATLHWGWDTSALDAGEHILTFSLLPDGPTWQETVSLRSASEKPLNEQDARWETATTDCCVIHYITGTEAERDLTLLTERVNTEAEVVEEQMRTDFTEPVSITFLPRTLGQGGFATDSIYVSYLDQNYAGGQPELVVRHEMVHILDVQLGGNLRPVILLEGLATFMSGGHFKTEPIAPRAAVLLDLGWYIPLRDLTDNFYPSQHEIGYLEAAALVQYLVETYTWEKFNFFYRTIAPAESGTESDAVDAALRTHFGVTFDEVEQDFKAYLSTQPEDPTYIQDVSLTVGYYDTIRRYQQLLDSSAYFMTAWLPDANVMRMHGIVADYMRHPNSAVNIGIESMLVQADEALRSGDYDTAGELLKSINVMLDILQGQ